MEWQLYWPAWWHLWPHFSAVLDDDLPVEHCVFAVGPLQFRWLRAC